MFKKFLKLFVLVAILALVAFSGSATLAWTGPGTLVPPACTGLEGCNPPLNTGSTTQIKTGSLGILGILGLVTEKSLDFASDLGATTGSPNRADFAGILGYRKAYKADWDGVMPYAPTTTGTPRQTLVVIGGGAAGQLGNRLVKLWDNLDVVGTTTASNVDVHNNVYAKNFYTCTSPGSCSILNPGGSYWTASGANIYNSNTGDVGINSLLDLGFSKVAGTERHPNAGKIGYAFLTHGTPGTSAYALDVVGAGPNLPSGQRWIKLWDNLIVPGTTTLNNLVVNNVCTATGSCSPVTGIGDSFWTNNGNSNAPIENTNSLGNVRIKGSLFILDGGSGSSGRVVKFNQVPYVPASEIGWHLRYNSSASTEDALDIIGDGTAIGKRLARIWDNLTVPGTTTLNNLVVNNICTGPDSCKAVDEIGGDGNWTKSGTNLYPTTLTDKVGIGTNNPAHALHVISRETGDNANYTIGIARADKTAQAYWLGVGDTGDFKLFNQSGTAGGTLMTVTNSGNVGIGTTNPMNLLSLGTSYGASLGAAAGKKLAIYNNASGEDFYGIGVTASTLEFHAQATSTEVPGMALKNTGALDVLGRIQTPGLVIPYLGVGGSNLINLGSGSGDEANAGKIAYAGWSNGATDATPYALDIVGAGKTNSPRTVKVWDNLILPNGGDVCLANGTCLSSLTQITQGISYWNPDTNGINTSSHVGIGIGSSNMNTLRVKGQTTFISPGTGTLVKKYSVITVSSASGYYPGALVGWSDCPGSAGTDHQIEQNADSTLDVGDKCKDFITWGPIDWNGQPLDLGNVFGLTDKSWASRGYIIPYYRKAETVATYTSTEKNSLIIENDGDIKATDANLFYLPRKEIAPVACTSGVAGATYYDTRIGTSDKGDACICRDYGGSYLWKTPGDVNCD